MDARRRLRPEGIVREEFANDLLAAAEVCGDARANAKRVALLARERNVQPIRFWQPILEHQKRAAARLAHDQVLHAVAIEIDWHDGPAIAVAVGAASESGDFEECFAARIQE